MSAYVHGELPAIGTEWTVVAGLLLALAVPGVVAYAAAGGVHGPVMTAGLFGVVSIVTAHLIPADARAGGEGYAG
jgi:hypothetical protein